MCVGVSRGAKPLCGTSIGPLPEDAGEAICKPEVSGDGADAVWAMPCAAMSKAPAPTASHLRQPQRRCVGHPMRHPMRHPLPAVPSKFLNVLILNSLNCLYVMEIGARATWGQGAAVIAVCGVGKAGLIAGASSLAVVAGTVGPATDRSCERARARVSCSSV